MFLTFENTIRLFGRCITDGVGFTRISPRFGIYQNSGSKEMGPKITWGNVG